MMQIQRFIKTQMDFWIALVVLIVCTLPFLMIALLIVFDSKGPIFFRQERVGKYGKIFKIWKFRTMVDHAAHIGLGLEIAHNDSRITRVGKFLRRFGIDEIPQIFNILAGQMSLVGPRAALPHQVAQYTDFEKKRLEVKPGVTNINILKGWNTLPWKERIKWDVWYVEHWSLWLDLKILTVTPIIVLSGKGQYGEKGVVEDYKRE
ncbi:MAG: sugar transferase [Candidatus Wildermuthbacteria bacterium]|nr:sugar transferase [Candidatus Wildermuthbacteria bacterium]